MGSGIEKTLNVLRYTKESEKAYNAKHADAGYHAIKLNGEVFGGQRDCFKRFEFINKEINFSELNILDIGCNVGGMLYPISHKINSGIGIDCEYKNINACNRVRSLENYENLHFYVFDLEKEDFDFMKNFLKEDIDVIFLFSICLWVKNWRELIDWIHENSDTLFIETHGFSQEEQYQYVKSKYKITNQLYDKSIDDPSNHDRKLYVAYK